VWEIVGKSLINYGYMSIWQKEVKNEENNTVLANNVHLSLSHMGAD
jgi:hypothetical protein